MSPKTPLLFALLSLTLSSAHATEEDIHKTVKDLRSQVEMLTVRLLQLEQRLIKQETPIAPIKAHPPLQNAKVDVGDTKGSFKVPGTSTSLAIGGYIKLDAIYNSQSVGGNAGENLGDQILQASSIPTQKNDKEQDEITFHARQSRFWLKSYTPSKWGDLNTYLEMDFFAFQSPGDERVSNSYAPRLRHAFGSLGSLLAGQTWTTFMNVKALPELNDFGGPVGRIFARQPQIRWTQAIGAESDLMIAIESPETTLTNTKGIRETPDDDHFPDIISRFNINRPWGTVSLATMLRNIQSNVQTSSNAFGGAMSLAGRINTIERDDVRFMLNYGNVLGRYASSNLFNDGAINAQGEIELFNQYGGFIAYRHWWGDNWRSTLAYGFSYADNVDFVPTTVSQWAQSAQFNLLWSPLPQTTFGLEYTYASKALENNDSGHIHRMQFSSVFNF